MVTSEDLKTFSDNYDRCSLDVFQSLLMFKKAMIDKMIAEGIPETDFRKVAETSVLWMIKRYYDDHLAMAEAQSFINQMFPNKESDNDKI